MKGLKQNKLILSLMTGYFFVIILITLIACNYAYHQKQGELLNEMDIVLADVVREYQSITDDFWRIFLPIFENYDHTYHAVQTFFSSNREAALSPIDKMELSKALHQMCIRDDRIQWIAVISDISDTDYIYFPDATSLRALDNSFPYWANLAKQDSRMEILGHGYVRGVNMEYSSIAICGGSPRGTGDGKIVVGFRTEPLDSIGVSASVIMPSMRYNILLDNESIYMSAPDTPQFSQSDLASGMSRKISLDGTWVYVKVAQAHPRASTVYCSILWNDLSRASYSDTLGILRIIFIVALMSVVLYVLIIKAMSREVKLIHDGLDTIGHNQLDYRINAKFRQSGFAVIAASINQMAQRLSDNIERAQAYEKKQREAELQELQSKFNPHFLYNSLEIFRSRCYQNGDSETAELISQTASLFRGYIGSRTLVSIGEELAFSKRYLALFRARFDDKVRVMYDIDSEVLGCSVIRNVLQPLIENYFEHGFDSSRDNNILRFSGSLHGDEYLLLCVEDNGMGASPDKLMELRKQLEDAIASDNESYGLRNLHQRLRLYYGDACGLNLSVGELGGLCVEMHLKRVPASEQADPPSE